jgi:hypothetical protein
MTDKLTMETETYKKHTQKYKYNQLFVTTDTGGGGGLLTAKEPVLKVWNRIKYYFGSHTQDNSCHSGASVWGTFATAWPIIHPPGIHA